MSRATATKSPNLEKAIRQVYKGTAPVIIEAIAIQMDRIDESKRRIDEEGVVVRDLKGSVIPHPAIKVEQDAIKLINDLIAKNRG